MSLRREDGVLLQAHGTTMETRGHWYKDGGGGEWLRLVLWHSYDGRWVKQDEDQLSSVALEALRLLLNARAAAAADAAAVTASWKGGPRVALKAHRVETWIAAGRPDPYHVNHGTYSDIREPAPPGEKGTT